MNGLPSRLAVYIRYLALLIVLSGLLTLAAGVAVIDRYGLVDQAQPADVIIVLGSRVEADGQPSPSLARRAAHAAALYHRGLAPAILCTGGVTTGPVSEAAAACGYAAALGVPPEATFLEERATTTTENALYSAAEMRRHAWHTAILVSDGFHLYRAALLAKNVHLARSSGGKAGRACQGVFQRTGITVYPSSAQVTAGAMFPLERWVREVRELAALAQANVQPAPLTP